MNVYTLRAFVFSLFLMAGGVVYAAPIDDQTPIPDASLVSDHTLSRQKCISNHSTSAQGSAGTVCVALDLSYPATTHNWIAGYIRSALLYRLSGNAHAVMGIAQAADGFLSNQLEAIKDHTEGQSSFVFSWKILGQFKGLVVLSEDVLEHSIGAGEQRLRQFTVLDIETQQAIELAEVLIAGQGEALANLQVQALRTWLMQQGQLSHEEAEAAVAVLPVRYTENWALSQGALVFSYDPVLLRGRVQQPLIVLSADTLEGVIRPDILTTARSWPVAVPMRLSQSQR